MKTASSFILFLLISLTSFVQVFGAIPPIIINAQEYYGNGSFFIKLARLSTPEVANEYCGIPHLFELRKQSDLSACGTVTIYNDGLNLNLQYNLNSSAINEGWGIVSSLVWLGLPQNWDYGRDGPDGGWSAVPDIIRDRYSSLPTTAVHKIPLEDWMLNECFTIAIRVPIEDKEQNRLAPKALVNHGDYLTYAWNDLFCLDKCDDPGTQTKIFWKNNPDVWTKGVTIGGIFYSDELAIQIMKGITTNDDMSNVLFEELVSAKLNVDLGNTSYCIIEAIETADAWMEENGPVGNGILSGHPAWNTGNSMANQLESYNNGLMCADPAN